MAIWAGPDATASTEGRTKTLVNAIYNTCDKSTWFPVIQTSDTGIDVSI